ncbi:MAG: TaqI-like C-terminal specificity domain-containing protein, partial [Candidatus Hodarchaeota archaeon]
IDLIILEKIKQKSIEFGNFCYVNWGARTGNVKKYVVDTPGPRRKRMVDGRDIEPYFINKPHKYMIYKKEELYNPMFEELFENEKLIIPDITGKRGVVAALDSEQLYAEHTVSLAVKWCDIEGVKRRGLKFSPKQKTLSQQYDLKYLLAQINSSVARYVFRMFLSGQLHTYPNDIKKLPIFRIDFSNKLEREIYHEIILLSTKLMALKKATSNAPSVQALGLEKEIDELIRGLYALETSEIKHIKKILLN